MPPMRRPHNSKAPKIVHYNGSDHSGPASIYRSTPDTPRVSLATFTLRFRRMVESGNLSTAGIDEALNLSPKEFQAKYSIRRTFIEVDDSSVDLLAFYDAHSGKTKITYRNFWQRIRSLAKGENLSGTSLQHALSMPPDSWKSFYGGGRRRGFIYQGDEYPEHFGQSFHSTAAFLRSVGRYEERSLIWSRLKAGWNLDDALSIPSTFPSHRSGSIYRVTRRTSGHVYVGLTITSIEQRWSFHVRAARSGSTSKLHVAIREDGADNFDIAPLEQGIAGPELLKSREIYWTEKLDTLGPDGLNTAKPGGLGSPAGIPFKYGDETFRSKAEATDVFSQRSGIASHVVRKLLDAGKPIPAADQVRRHSRHKDAGTNLYRRWLALHRRHVGNIAEDWCNDYDAFKRDVSPAPENLELIRKHADEPWGPRNFEWVSIEARIQRKHGKSFELNGTTYPSLKAVAAAHGIGVSTLKHRLSRQGMTIEEAVAAPLGLTSCKQRGKCIMIDEIEFRSKRQAILFLASKHGITEHQAKYRFSIGLY